MARNSQWQFFQLQEKSKSFIHTVALEIFQRFASHFHKKRLDQVNIPPTKKEGGC